MTTYLFINNIEIFIPEIFLSMNILFLLLFSTLFFFNNINIKLVFFKILNKLIIYILFIVILFLFNIQDPYNIALLNIFYSNLNIKFIKIFIIFLTILCLLLFNYKKDIYFNEILIIFLFALLGLLLFLSSYNFIVLYLSLELFSLSFYTLTALKRNSILSAEAALKYFIYGALSSGLILYGISLLYGVTGILNFKDLYLFFFNNNYYTYNFIIQFSLLLILSGFLFKIGVAPYHTWLPDVYEGSLINVTMFFVLVPKIVIFYLISLFYFVIFYNYSFIQLNYIIYIFILASLIIGIFGTVFQKKIKRLFAYSSISHSGYLLFIFLTKEIDNLTILYIYIIIYILINIGLWTSFIYLQENKQFKYITDFIGLAKINLNFSLMISILFFSIAGIPPLLGFFSKFFVFLFAIKNFFIFLSIIAIILSCISAFYYIRIIKLIFFEKKYNSLFFIKIPTEYVFILTFCVFLNIFFFFFSYSFINILEYSNIGLSLI